MKIDTPRPGMIPLLKNLWAEAFGDSPAYIDLFFSAAYSPNRCLCITEGAEVLAAAHWLRCQQADRQYAYIYAVATAKVHRGRGLCRRLMSAIHERLAAEGFAGAILVPGDNSLPQMYANMGYAFFGGIREFTCSAGPTAAALHPLSAAQYGRLRRTFLPEDGVVQAQENLRYLATQAQFAAGEDYLLAYKAENSRLVGLELLGNADAAPGIVCALGCTQGRFRTPGNRPFAMFYPLQAVPAPKYFGFAFD